MMYPFLMILGLYFPKHHVLISVCVGSLSVQEMGTEQWILANMKRTGFYRTNYDEANWDLLIKQLREDHTVCLPVCPLMCLVYHACVI